MNEPGRPWRAATLWLAALGSFFILSYTFSNWVAAQRHNVPSIVFGWEHRIPFLPWTIVPYWSADFFYTLTFFTCRNRKELDTYAKRILAAQIISVTCFLLFPLQFSFPHPKTSGPFGWLFYALGNFDRPFNQAPSLHLSITAILWAQYTDRPKGYKLFLLRCWFVLVGVSTLTTYQHHFIDILPGIWVGLACIVLFPMHKRAAPASARSLRIAAYYFLGGALCTFAGFWIGGWGWLLFWPASSSWIVAGAYAFGSPGILQAHAGHMQRAMILLLAPHVPAKWLYARLWTLRQPIAQEIAEGVWLGRAPLRREREALGFASMVVLAAELPVDTSGVVVRSVPMLDLLVPTREQLDAVVEAIDGLAASRPTLVCCALGYSRAAASVAAWLLANDAAPSVEAAIEMIRRRRPVVVLRDAHRDQLETWAAAKVPR